MPATESQSSHGMQTAVPAGQHRQVEAQEAVGADLQKHAGQEDAAGRGGFRMRQRQPGVQRKERHLDGKAGEQGQKQPRLQRGAHAGMIRGGVLQVGRQFGDGERHPRPVLDVPVVPEDDGQQAQERQHAAGQREEEELDRRVAPLVAAPDADEEEERHQRELEKEVEENDVAGDEHAQHAGAQEQQKPVIKPFLILDSVPAHQHGD